MADLPESANAPGLAGTHRLARAQAGAACFHCGLTCPPECLVKDGQSFCCVGCQTVYSLLNESGLGQYYQLNSESAPGTRTKPVSGSSKWACLDDPAVAEKLLDFNDGKTAKVRFQLPQIHCVACVWLIENLFRIHPAIGRSVADFAKREASITFAPGELRLSELASLLASIGYEPALSLNELEKKPQPVGVKKQQLQIGVAGFGFGNIMLLAIPGYFGFDAFSGPFFKHIFGWLGLLLALPVLIYSASDFWRTAWVGIRRGVPTLDLPIAAGIAAIYGQSVYDILWLRGGGYLDSLTGLIFFLLCGRLFSQKAHERLAFDRDYKAFFPLSITRREAGREEQVAISRLEVGNRLVIRSGELVPADARLISGAACLDYSFVTGEHEPAPRAVGELIYAGGRQIGGCIEVETVKPVSQSYLASLWSSAAFRKERGDSLDTLTNRYSRRFTWVVLGMAISAALFWLLANPANSIKAFVSVLIVACPCALALAAPLSLGTAQRLMRRRNIFIKNSQTVERLAEIDTIVLDKTGTLTTSEDGGGFVGEPLSADEARWIFSLARQSVHPNSLRIARQLGASGADTLVAEFVEEPGQGIQGLVEGRRVRLGAKSWAAQSEHAEQGIGAGSAVCISIDGKHRGRFELANRLRPEVDEMVQRLGERYNLVLLSGDSPREEGRFRRIFGAKADIRFGQSPFDKLAYIEGLQQSGRRVMMVGDGLNDAGALRQSDVGVAVVEKIGAFSPASDIILGASEIPDLPSLLDFSRRSTGVIRTGFAVSAVYNIIGVSVAASARLSPLVCAALMPLSSISVAVFVCGLTRWISRKAGFRTPTVDFNL